MYLVFLQDGLLAQGNQDLILRIFSKIPKMSPDGKRLQVNEKHDVELDLLSESHVECGLGHPKRFR